MTDNYRAGLVGISACLFAAAWVLGVMFGPTVACFFIGGGLALAFRASMR